ncbi:MAG: type II toxin-antitoxin system VapC family toxin [Candidatus Limnocylindria bacterium]
MIFIDANLLLYAYDEESPKHAAARSWLERTLGGDEEVRIPLVSVLAFVRIGTNPSVFRVPLDAGEAIRIVEQWLDRAGVELGMPTTRHWPVLLRMARDGQARGPLVMDAHLAALTAEHGGVLCTTDRDFARFEGLKFRNPLTSGNAR